MVSSILLAYGGQLYSLFSTGKSADTVKVSFVFNVKVEPLLVPWHHCWFRGTTVGSVASYLWISFGVAFSGTGDQN